jgi:hypothetical protein
MLIKVFTRFREGVLALGLRPRVVFWAGVGVVVLFVWGCVAVYGLDNVIGWLVAWLPESGGEVE